MGLGISSYIFQFLPILIYITILLVLLITIKNIKIGIYMLILLAPLSNLIVKLYKYPFGSNLIDFLYICFFINIFFVNNSKNKTVNNNLDKLMIYYIIFTIFSFLIGYLFWGYSLSLDSRVLKDFKNFLMLPLLYFIVRMSIFSKREVRNIINIMIFILFITTLYYYLNIHDKDLSSFRKDIRTGFIFYYLGANELAAFFVHFIFLPLGLFYYQKNKLSKIFLLFLSIFMLYPIAFLFSRGAYIAFIAGLLFLSLIKKSKLIFTLIIIIIIGWNVLLPTAVVQRINMTESESGLDHASRLRLTFWKIGLSEFKRSPLFGVGFESSVYFRGGDLHNKYIEILSEEGIIGLFIFLSLLYYTFKNGIYINKYANDNFLKGLGLAISTITVSCATTNFFGDRWQYFELSAYFFTIMAISSICVNLIKKNDIITSN